MITRRPLPLMLCLSALMLHGLYAGPPDLTVPGAMIGIDQSLSYNLGPTGLRGWIYLDGNNVGDVGMMTDASRQILITVASEPGSAVIAKGDVLLGAIAAKSGKVPNFNSDCRKAFGAAIGAAEQNGAGTLRVKRWRAGSIDEVNIPLQVMGRYSATAPYLCPKSSMILARARDKMVSDLLSNRSRLVNDYAGAVDCLALLASVEKDHPEYARVQALLQRFARDCAHAGPDRAPLYIWDWAYKCIFLSEYYLITADPEVVSGINAYTCALARAQSIYGTFGHSSAELKPDGSKRRICIGYGPVNAVGSTANLAILMGKTALLSAKQKIDPDIDTALKRGSDFFAWYTNKGSIPYGEHQPYAVNHASNGKDGATALLFGLQPDRARETEYFARIATAGWIGREYGHTGQGLSYLWTALGANMGGPMALAEHLKKVRWHLDLSRRTDGSFVYDGQEQYGMGSTTDGTYLGKSDYNGLNMTAAYVLTFSAPLKRLYITGKNPMSTNTLDATQVANAIDAGSFRLHCNELAPAELIAKLNEFDPVVRYFAATELGKRKLPAKELTMLRKLLTSPNVNERQGACMALGALKDGPALPVIVERLRDPDVWARAKAADAIRCYDSATAGAHVTSMMNAFIANATNPDVIDWNDPLQIGNGRLSLAIFGNGVGDGTVGNDVAEFAAKAPQSILYPAIRAGLKQPDSYPRTGVAQFCKNHLSLEDIQALFPDMIEVVSSECQADRMWSASPRALGLRMLAAHKIADGIPLALSMLDAPPHFEMGADEYRVAALDALSEYGEAARFALPRLKTYLNAWGPQSPEYLALVNVIQKLETAIDAPKQIPGSAVAVPQVITTNGTKAITLSGSSPRGPVSYIQTTKPAHGVLTGTAPKLTYTPNPDYKGIDGFTFQTKDALTTSEVASVGIVVGAAGNGLKGVYFENPEFSRPKLTRTDAAIDFDWGSQAPDRSMEANGFSVRWSGLLLIPESGTYQFSALSNDGVRLYLNGSLILDKGSEPGTRWIDSTPIQLNARQLMEIQLEYFNHSGPAVAKLKWIGPGIAGRQGSIIPKDYLFDGSSFPQRTPYAHSQSLAMVKNTTGLITLTGSGGLLRFAVKSKPLHGTLSGREPYLKYTPHANYCGPDSFTFLAHNEQGTSTPGTISIQIAAGAPKTYTWAGASGYINSGACWADQTAPAATGEANYHLDFKSKDDCSVTHDANDGFKLNQMDLNGPLTFEGDKSFAFMPNGTTMPELNQNGISSVVFNTPIRLEETTLLGGSGGGMVTLSGMVSGKGGMTKDNPGVLKITNAANSYSGGTIINAGKVMLPEGGGPTSFLGTGPVTLNPNATLQMTVTHLSNPITLNQTTLTAENGFPSSLSGPVTLIGNTTFQFGTTGTFEIQGTISGDGGFTTVGTTEWKLSGKNNYTGPTVIQAGGLCYETADSMAPGELIIKAGAHAKLNFNGNGRVSALNLGGKDMPPGSYGSRASNAGNRDDTYFSGTGKVTVSPTAKKR